ncbi:MAG: FkbM family methyltransferase [Thermoplasmata archaeon]|nr:FkbM family methyltransferase [Thermoplasmata archaeon]
MTGSASTLGPAFPPVPPLSALVCDLPGGVRLAYSHPQDIAGILEVFVLDAYELRDLAIGSVVVDLGAGIGDFAVAASRRVGGGGLVIAVEPSPGDFDLLRRNLAANRCTNVRAVNAALAPHAGPLPLTFKGLSFDARGVPLPELLREAAVSWDGRHLGSLALKIDIEGAEAGALVQLGALLPQVSAIAIELHGTRAAVDEVLRPHGFVFRRLSRGTTIRRSVGFLLRHPVVSAKLWRAYRRTRLYSGWRKILRGIDITASERLAVGVYRRVGEAGAPAP